jgi:hypothetical protein
VIPAAHHGFAAAAIELRAIQVRRLRAPALIRTVAIASHNEYINNCGPFLAAALGFLHLDLETLFKVPQLNFSRVITPILGLLHV